MKKRFYCLLAAVLMARCLYLRTGGRSESRRWLKQCDFTYSGCCRQNDSYHYN